MIVSTTEELVGRKSSGSGLESREDGRRSPSRWPRGTLYSQKLTLTSPTSGGRSDGIVRSLTQATEFSLVLVGGALDRDESTEVFMINEQAVSWILNWNYDN
jgi:hypothetical protein